MKFSFSLENLRGLAIIFVMLSHLNTWTSLGPLGKYLHFLFVDATSWFVFLSGYLFVRIEGTRFSYPAYMAKKAKFVILPYLILSTPVILLGLYLGQNKLIGISAGAFAAWSLLVGGYVVAPMWFIPMITIFFLLSPVFLRIARSPLVFPLGVVGIVFTLFSSRPGALNPFFSFLHFAGFYLLGMAFAVGTAYTQKIARSTMLWPCVAVGLGIFALAMCLYDGVIPVRPAFHDSLGILNPPQLGKLALLVVLFLLFERYFDRKNTFLAYFADNSFGLFFIHGFFMVAITRASYLYGQPNVLLNFLIELVVVIGLSLLTVALIKLVLQRRSRYVIGC